MYRLFRTEWAVLCYLHGMRCSSSADSQHMAVGLLTRGVMQLRLLCTKHDLIACSLVEVSLMLLEAQSLAVWQAYGVEWRDGSSTSISSRMPKMLHRDCLILQRAIDMLIPNVCESGDLGGCTNSLELAADLKDNQT